MCHSRFFRIIATVLLVTFSTCALEPAFAQDIPRTPDVVEVDSGQFTYVNKGAAAPFAGYLFDQKGSVQLLIRTEFAVRRIQLDSEHALRLLEAKDALQIDLLKTSLEAREKEIKLITETKDAQIADYKKLADSSRDNSLWYFIGGFGGGLLVALAVFFAVSYGAKN